MGDDSWIDLARCQGGLVSRRQLRELGVRRAEVRHHIEFGRWAVRSGEVISTTTGPLSPHQRLWLGVLHGGASAMVGGLSATAHHGMTRWDRDEISIHVANRHSFEPLPGYRFFRTRRDFQALVAPGELPVCRVQPAVLLFAAHERHLRTALGAVTAVVQQRLATVDQLRIWLEMLTPLRRSRQLGELLEDLAGGAQSLTEVDFRKACTEYEVAVPRRQTPRTDRHGRRRYTDCEWLLADGRVLILEIDGAFHDDVLSAAADRARNRALTSSRRTVIQCSAYEVRHEPWVIMADLLALGVPRAGG